MDNLENWEETISSKFNEQQIPFDEMDWDRVEEKIDAMAARGKRKKWALIYLFGIFTGSLLMFGTQKLFFSSENKSQTIAINSNSQNSSGVDKQKNNLSPTSELKNENSNSGNAPQNSNQVNSNSSSTQENSIVYSNSTGNRSHKNYSRNSIERNSFEANDVAVVSNQKNTNNNLGANSSSEISNNTNVVATASENKLTATNNVPAKEISPVENKNPVVAQNKKNNLMTVSNTNIPSALDSIHHRKNHIAVEVGTNYLLGWYHPADGRGFNPVGGFVLAHEFNSGYIGTIGVRYEQLGHLEESQKKFINSNPGFGLNNSSTIIVPLKLHYVSLPLKVERSFTGNIFGIGANISYLLNTSSRLETWTENDSHQLTIIDSRTSDGYLGGFNRWDAAITASYRRQLLPKFGIQMEATYGLIDVKNNYYFSNSKNFGEHTFGFRAMLTYRLY